MRSNNVNRGQHVSVLKRLSGDTTRQQQQRQTPRVNDARELLTKKNILKKSPASSFDARQLIQERNKSASSSSTITTPFRSEQMLLEENPMVVVTGLKDIRMRDGRMVTGLGPPKPKKIFNVGPSTFVTIRNNPANPQSLFTKTFTNNLARMDMEDNDDDEMTKRQESDDLSSLSDQKVVVSVVNDLYKKVNKPATMSSSTTATITSSSSVHSITNDRARLPIQRKLPVKRQHNDASIQTVTRTTSPPLQQERIRGIRSPIRRTKISTSTTTHDINEDLDIDEPIEPPPKRAQLHSTQQHEHQQSSYLVRKTIQQTSNNLTTTKRTSTTAVSTTTAPIGRLSTTMEKQNLLKNLNDETTVLVTNLHSTVTEDDVMELFGQAGQINHISVLSRGCIQIVYKHREHAEQACSKYHNRLLDGQLMYVSLQQPDTSLTPLSSTKTTSTNIGSPLTTTMVPQVTTTVNKPILAQSQQKDNGRLNQPLKLNTPPTTTNGTNNPMSTTTNNKIIIDPTLIRQALFQPSTNNTNPVQFQGDTNLVELDETALIIVAMYNRINVVEKLLLNCARTDLCKNSDVTVLVRAKESRNGPDKENLN
ncbi:unnamed protein product [Didymodactylos carnosus]|uniref:RRM domain-containing protein n=1 Tax=Didymodactylos carnosus TaxID=1234261 RepID=A0A813VZG0_9BILA|nr:unnamed protein product [Didymodactylos carnosus]CAF3632375.1 unnamed protein product [Didymodactylos carnosus]